MRRSLTCALVLILGVAGVACGGSGDKPEEALRAAADKTIAAGSARTALTLVTSAGAQAGGAKTTRGTGAVDFAGKRATFAIDTSSLGLPGVSGSIDLVLVDGVIYAKVASLIPGKPWLKLDPATLGTSGNAALGGLGDLASGDPAAGVRFLRAVADGAKKVGSETIRGTATTHYRGTVDLQRLAVGASASTKTSVDALIKSLGTSTYPVDVWLDDAGRVRRLRSQQTAKASGSTPAATVVRTEEYSAFGVKVAADVPPADQVTDLAQLLQGAGQK